MGRISAFAARLVCGIALCLGAMPIMVASTARPARAATGGPSISLLSQTPFISRTGTFRARLIVTDPNPAGDFIQVSIYSHLGTRTGFDQAVAGRLRGGVVYRSEPQVVDSLPIDGAGGVDVDIPVNPTTEVPGSFSAHYGSAVYPVTYQLFSQGRVPMGSPLTTFLIYSSGPSTALPRLAVALSVPVAGPADIGPSPTRFPSGAASAIAAEVAALADNANVPVTLAVSPDTMDRLKAGSVGDRAVVAALADRIGRAGDELQPATYLPASVSSLTTSGLGTELSDQYAAGQSVLEADLRRSPDPSSSVITGRVDLTTLSVLFGRGVQHLVLPDSALSPLPAYAQQITYARPTELASHAGDVPVVATDTGLSELLGGHGEEVLDGERILAGLAMVQLEAPGRVRGVALSAPGDGSIDSQVLSTVLAGLDGNPFARAVTVEDLFHQVPTDSPSIIRTFQAARAAPPIPEAASIRAVHQQVNGLAAIVPKASRTISPLRRQLLAVTSSVINDGPRRGLLSAITAQIHQAEGGISLPGSSSVTLTARQGTIPLTVLSNPSLDARVLVRISSQKITFRSFNPPGGRCQAGPSSVESCQLELTSEATTLRIPVESRTSGVFSMEVLLASPDGSVVLAQNRDTVRSTAFSGVGIVLIVLATLGLLTWWIRDARHGRRARQLVDPERDMVDLTASSHPQAHDPPTPPPARAASEFAPPSDEPGRRASADFVSGGLPPFPDAGTAAVTVSTDDQVDGSGPGADAPGNHLGDAPEAPSADSGTLQEGASSWLDEDPVIADFFGTPPPVYGDEHGGSAGVSPFGHHRGQKS